MAMAMPPRRPTQPMQSDTCSFLLRLMPFRTAELFGRPLLDGPAWSFGLRTALASIFPYREPSHEAWLLCNIRKYHDFRTLASALLPTEQEIFCDTAHYRASRRAGGARLSIDACDWRSIS